jgi:hypothetical protein
MGIDSRFGNMPAMPPHHFLDIDGSQANNATKALP